MDLDDLLEDVPDKNVVSKKPVSKPKPKAKQEDDAWGELGLEDEGVKSTAGFGSA
jgi:hypothetical protein